MFQRLASAVITAAGVVLLAVGLLTLAAPATGAGPGSSPTGLAATSPLPSPSGRPSGSPSASPSPAPGHANPTRIVIADLKIDLPIVSTQTSFPLCNVAQFLINSDEKLGLPGQLGSSAYIYAHARTGMFLPLLTASETANGDGMLGFTVQVYTDDDLVYTYVISQVKRHSEDFTIASSIAADAQQLVLQTSEGPTPNLPKLQVAATFVSVAPADHAAAHPTPHPVTCS
ncbi:MAG TPA: hypothetical protein VMH24_03205 [Candidatus Sulfotelmatobacter sp.]|nr:hypothetical protein [Candidatus Sulfotelmatobacter sp.]